jgi:hypothetical protein
VSRRACRAYMMRADGCSGVLAMAEDCSRQVSGRSMNGVGLTTRVEIPDLCAVGSTLSVRGHFGAAQTGDRLEDYR